MQISQRWPKAFIISFAFHFALLGALGFASSSLFSAPPVIEQVIELDLAQGQPAASAPAAAAPPSSPTAAAPLPPPSPVADAETAPIQSVIADDALTVDAAQIPFTGSSGDTSTTAVSTAVSGTAANGINGSSERSGITPPRILSKAEPEYPSAARQDGQQGTVILKVQILENGRPGFIDIYSTSGYAALDNAAVAAVRKWRFTPAKDSASGRAIQCTTTLPVSFRLQ